MHLNKSQQNLERRGWEKKSQNFFDMKGGFSRGDEGEESRNNFLFFPLSLNGFRGVGDLFPRKGL
jgi:hypothetical protein